MSKFCPNCGKKVNDKDRFCNACGSSLTSSTSNIEYTNGTYKPDRGIYEMFFKLSGRINPKRYLIRVMILVMITYSLVFLSFILSENHQMVAMPQLIIQIGLLIAMIPLNVRRCHDLGRPGWYFLLIPIPIISGAIEVAMVRSGWWYKKDGEYREYREIKDWSLLFSLLYCMFMSIFAIFLFTFSSGVNGENKYGPDPTGPSIEVPDQSNPILGVISTLEEKTSSLVVGILMFILLLFPGYIVKTMSSINQSAKAKQNITVQQTKNNQSNKSTESPKKKQVKESEPETKSKKVDIPQQSSKTTVAQSLQNQAQNDAVYVFTTFHDNITKGNLRQAYDTCLSNNLKSKMTYESWAPGFDTTISSTVNDIKVYSENQNQIILTYILTAIDKIKGKTQTEKFNGTVVMINQNGSWKIDDMKNKQRK